MFLQLHRISYVNVPWFFWVLSKLLHCKWSCTFSFTMCADVTVGKMPRCGMAGYREHWTIFLASIARLFFRRVWTISPFMVTQFPFVLIISISILFGYKYFFFCEMSIHVLCSFFYWIIPNLLNFWELLISTLSLQENSICH